MADKDKDMFTERDAVTFEENTEQYCKNVYAEAKRRNDQLSPINVENRLFYEGKDGKLDEREQDANVMRSALFIHELKPDIDTRRSDVIVKLEQNDPPVTIRPRNENASDQEKANALWIQDVINNQLRDCGYMVEGFGDHILASEIQRSPATVKVGWENNYEKVPVAYNPTEQDILMAAKAGRVPPKPYVRFENRYKGGRPYVELLDPDEFFYEPTVSNFQRDSEYSGHGVWVSWNRLMSMAKEHGWDINKLKRNREELVTENDRDGEQDSFRDQVNAENEVPTDKGVRDGKILVLELYVCTYTDSGEEEVWQVIFVANKFVVSKKRTPYKGIKHPFVPATPNKLPNSIEGLSSVDIGKNMQRLYNELFNSFLDGMSYRIFPPLVRETQTVFTKTPKWYPGAIFDVHNAQGLTPLIQNPGPIPDLAGLMEAVSAKLRRVLNSEDISQGFQAQPYEKATSTQLRAVGSAKRAIPTNKIYGQALIEVAQMFLALNQQYHEEKIKFVQDVIIDVPSLTQMSDPENEKQESLLILAQAMTLPFYQTPIGQMKLRNIFEDVIRKIKRLDVDRYIPSEGDLQSDQEAQRQLALAQFDKQTAMESLGMEQQTQQNAKQATVGG